MKHGMLLVVAAFVAVVPLAQAIVPGEVNFQGLLLDDLGAPVTATVAMDFELFDAASGGTSLWTESHPTVQVVDGVYNVALGETVPLSPTLVAGGSLHLEVSVDSEVLTPRQQLLVVPYALRSAVAEDAEQVNGLPSLALTQMFEHFSFDGADPPNDDPQEGLADVDGDGLSNFIDPDNDDDGLDDATELAQGTDINLVTPNITALVPPTADGFVVTSVQVQGSSFLPGLIVQFGGQNPTPTNLTPTSFDVSVGPQPEGTVSVVASLAGEASAPKSFDFFLLVPTIDSFDPAFANTGQALTVTVHGQNFTPGLTVQFGSQNPIPTNITSTSFDIAVLGVEPVGAVSTTVTLPNGKSVVSSGFVLFDRLIFVSSTRSGGNLGGLAAADAACNALASAVPLPGTYQAWLADSTQSPSTRSSQSSGTYRRPDGGFVASNWADLVDGNILNALVIDETGAFRSSPVWTNVLAVGAGATGSNHCGDWTTTSGTGAIGTSQAFNSTWTESGTGSCADLKRIYCVQQ